MFNTLLAYIASRKDIPEHFAARAANLVHASTNEVLIYLNIYWCLLFYNYKHTNSLTENYLFQASNYGSGAPSPNQVI